MNRGGREGEGGRGWGGKGNTKAKVVFDTRQISIGNSTGR